MRMHRCNYNRQLINEYAKGESGEIKLHLIHRKRRTSGKTHHGFTNDHGYTSERSQVFL